MPTVMKASPLRRRGVMVLAWMLGFGCAVWLGWSGAGTSSLAVSVVQPIPTADSARVRPTIPSPTTSLTMEQRIQQATSSRQLSMIRQQLMHIQDGTLREQQFSLLWEKWLQVDEEQAVAAAHGLPTALVLGLMREMVSRKPDVSLEPLAIQLGLDPRIVADSSHGSGRTALLQAASF
jgi:hypothetical protein